MGFRFCPSCGALLIPKRQGKQLLLYCPKEKIYYPTDNFIMTKKIPHSEKDRTIILDDSDIDYSSTRYCEACGKNVPVRIKQIQLRSADEPITTFYQCKAGHTWREE